jgi:hypothetical protein
MRALSPGRERPIVQLRRRSTALDIGYDRAIVLRGTEEPLDKLGEARALRARNFDHAVDWRAQR